MIERGGRIALPVVIKKGWPLEFRIWGPGDPLERGVWNILVPSHGPAVQPDVVIAPVVGFDQANYRLGYGGGFFDRTLAAMPTATLRHRRRLRRQQDPDHLSAAARHSDGCDRHGRMNDCRQGPIPRDGGSQMPSVVVAVLPASSEKQEAHHVQSSHSLG